MNLTRDTYTLLIERSRGSCCCWLSPILPAPFLAQLWPTVKLRCTENIALFSALPPSPPLELRSYDDWKQKIKRTWINRGLSDSRASKKILVKKSFIASSFWCLWFYLVSSYVIDFTVNNFTCTCNIACFVDRSQRDAISRSASTRVINSRYNIQSTPRNWSIPYFI